MIMKKTLFLIFAISLFSGCDKGQNQFELLLPDENVTIYENKVEFQKIGEYVIELDSMLGYFNQSISFLDLDKRSKLSILGVASNQIHIFDFNSGIEEKTIQLFQKFNETIK